MHNYTIKMNKYTKHRRREALRAVLSETKIGNQATLLRELENRGFRVTQATVSRDLRELGIIRVRTAGGGFRYERIETPDPATSLDRLRALARAAIRGVKGTGSLVLIKTVPGGAAGIASLIDGLEQPEILGTVAGDDTILVVVNGEEKRAHVEKSFRDLL